MSALTEALAASGPDPLLRKQLDLFGRFVGSWELDLYEYDEDGRVTKARGEWHWGWILEGRAVQDVWITPLRGERSGDGGAPVEYGTTLRFYDPAAALWRIVWSGPVKGRQIMLTAREVDDEIVLEGVESEQPLRWIFSELAESSFRWRAETSTDGGETWRLIQEMHVRRAVPAEASATSRT